MVADLGVRLSRIAIEGLGPIDKRTFELKRFNLVYGLNETGKTYVVEFLLRSLFRHAGDWPLRANSGVGKVFVTGLADEALPFSPEHDRKLEDEWEDQDLGLPMNMSRLLVVRGGELELAADGSDGADHQVLKKALSGEELLDDILSKIQSTVQEAELINGEIVGANRGDLKQRENLNSELAQIDRLQEQVQARLSGSRIEQIKQRKVEIETQLTGMERAKEHQAYLLEQELQEVDHRLSELSSEELDQVGQALHDREQFLADKKRLNQKLAETREQSANYEWLEQAVDVWQGWQLGDQIERPRWRLLLATLAIVVGAGVAIVAAVSGLGGRQLLLPMALAIFFIVAGLAGLLSEVIGLQRQQAAGVRLAEKQEVIEEFEDRFGEKPAGLADLRLRLEAEREAHSLLNHLQSELAEIEEKIQSRTASVHKGFRSLQIERMDEDQWELKLQGIQADRKNYLERKREAELELERLGVPADHRRSTPAEIEFDQDEWNRLSQELESVKAELAAAQQDLEGLKGEVTRFTGDKVTDSWEQVLASLWDKRTEVANEYRQLTSRILAQMAVTEVLDELRAEEDEKITVGLADPGVGEVLRQITGRYQSILLQEGRLVITSDTADYQFNDLSTGAQQQVLLALRLGLARRLAGGQPLFLLLDDAFQHSDWVRRKRLVDVVVETVSQGWQVTYLTMDDHLRDLIRARGEEEFGDQFSYVEL